MSTTAPTAPAIAPMAAVLSEADELVEADALAIWLIDGIGDPGTRGADEATGAATGAVSEAGTATRDVDERAGAGRSTSASFAAVRVGRGVAAARVVRRAVVCDAQCLSHHVCRTVLSAMAALKERGGSSARAAERGERARRRPADDKQRRRRARCAQRETSARG